MTGAMLENVRPGWCHLTARQCGAGNSAAGEPAGVLFFLWIAFAVVTVIAFFAILFTGLLKSGRSTVRSCP